MKTLSIALLFMAIAFSGCENKDDTHSVYDYEVSVNEQFQVDLVSNPSTGYSWKWTNKQTVTIVDSIGFSFVADTPVMPGSGGTEIWTFEGIDTGIDTLKFEYNQSWEPGSTTDSISIVVKVK